MGLTKRNKDVSFISLHLPGWFVRFDGWSLRYTAQSPKFESDGIEVSHRTAEEVVALAHVLMLHWSPGSGIIEAKKEVQAMRVEKPVPAKERERPSINAGTHPPAPAVLPAGALSGEACQTCGSLNVLKTGFCGTCQVCGSSTSCG